MSNYVIPSLLVAETYFPFKDDKGFAAGVVERKAGEGFYRSFEIGDGYDKEDRKRILAAKEKNNVRISQWLTYLTYKNNLDVSSLDKELRLESVRQMKESLYESAECGATYVSFIPGDDPGAALRGQGFEAFYESLCALCEEAAKYKIHISFEAMDREAHKKRLVGLTSEAVELISKVRKTHPNIGLAFDTAHAALNGEDLFDSLELAKSHIDQLHFANAVLDPKSSLFGDNHMPMGEPGFLTVEKMSRILQKAEELGIQAENGGLRVAVEARVLDKNDVAANEKTVQAVLEEALNAVGSK